MIEALLDKRKLEVEIELTNIKEVLEPVPVYEGDYQFTILDEDVVIPIEGKKATSDITVHQGIPLFTGATSYVIEDSGLTIATNGKRLISNITIDISALETLADEISEVVG